MSRHNISGLFSGERDQWLRDHWGTPTHITVILKAVNDLAGPELSGMQIAHRAGRLGLSRPPGFIGRAAQGDWQPTAEQQASREERRRKATEAARLKRAAEREAKIAARPLPIATPERVAVVQEHWAMGTPVTDIHRMCLELPGRADLTTTQVAAIAGRLKLNRPPGYFDRASARVSMARLQGAYRAAVDARPKKVKAPPLPKPAKPKPQVIAKPAPPVPDDSKAIARYPMSVIRQIAAAEGFLIDGYRDWQRFNDLRQVRGQPMLYLPLTHGRPNL